MSLTKTSNSAEVNSSVKVVKVKDKAKGVPCTSKKKESKSPNTITFTALEKMVILEEVDDCKRGQLVENVLQI